MTSSASTDTSAPSPASETTSPLRGGFAPLTIGMFLLVALSAFEQLATTTVMPIAAAETGGPAAFALASAAPLATGVLGTIAAGIWADRRGPRRVIAASVLCFVLGLTLTGIAFDITSLVVGRLVQGLGSGALTVAFYVVIGRLYPQALHPKVFSAFSAAWVLPGIMGPFIAGTVADSVGWRWVFLGGLAVVAVGVVALLAAWRRLGEATATPAVPVPWRRFVVSIALAAALVGLNLAMGIREPALGALVLIAAVIVGILSYRGLVPVGTLRAARGTPSILAIASLMLGAVLAVQAYLTLYLIEQRGFATATAGLILTFGGIAWPLSSWLHSRFAADWPSARVVGVGQLAVLIAIATTAATAVFGLNAWIAAITWALAGAGCGFSVPRLSGDLLRLAPPSQQGDASSSFAISQLAAPAVGIALAGTLLAVAGPSLGFPLIFVGAVVAPVLTLLIARRVAPANSAIVE